MLLFSFFLFTLMLCCRFEKFRVGGVGGARGLVSSLWRTQERMFVNSSSRAGLLKLYHAYEASLEPIKIQILLQEVLGGGGLRFSVLRKLPDDIDTTDLGRHFEERTLSMQVVGIWATYK